jgi:hypothetical protein
MLLTKRIRQVQQLLTHQKTQIALATALAFSLLWPSILPLLGLTDCWKLLPHHHILVGKANQRDLTAHELTEGTCSRDNANVVLLSSESRSPDSSLVLSIVQSDQLVPAVVASFMLYSLMAMAGVLLKRIQPRIVWWESWPFLYGLPFVSAPPTPPPRSH